MVKQDIYVKVFPYDTPYEKLEEFNPDGYFISNGPGDPKPLKKAQEVAKEIINENKPLFGICLLYTSPSPRDLSTSRMPSSA